VTTIRSILQPRAVMPAVVLVGVTWALSLSVLADTSAAQHVSNVGLAAVALSAGGAALYRGRAQTGPIRRVWLLFGAAVLSWGAGQIVWTWYESVLGREVPFPSAADIGYLGLPPLAGAALLCLPLAAPTLAGRVRTILDGLIVASSLLLTSWIVVLNSVIESGADSALTLVISLAYPVGDGVVITMVIYVWSRARQLNEALPLSLPLLGGGLIAFAVADTGFVYLTTSGSYSSGSLIDLGWFAGFTLMLLAALRPAKEGPVLQERNSAGPSRGTLLPYAAVTVAMLASVSWTLTTDAADPVVSWIRTTILALLVARQILTLRENNFLTRTLEQRVEARTAELRDNEQRFAALVQHSSDLVTVVDDLGTVRYQSESSRRVLGYEPEYLVGRSLFELMDAPHASDLLEALQQSSPERLRVHTLYSSWRHSTGRECQVEVTITNLLDNPAVEGLVLNTRDVTDRADLERQLTHQAFTDSLTGLPNRALFRDRLQHALSRREAAEGPLTVYFLDLDGFKAVNDSLGHSAGDELLVQVAHRLRQLLRASDTVARFGGDEFAILVDHLAEGDDGTGLAQRISDALQAPFDLQAEQVHVGVSVGIASRDSSATDAEQLLRNADLAMYQAKAEGTGGHAVYDPGMHAGLVERVRLASDLRKALAEGQLRVHYQPMVSMRTGEITGVEALVRWEHPERGLVPPDTFIPVAESTGVIGALGLWVLRESCRQAMLWRQDRPGAARLKLSVNVSARQLQHGDLPREVAEVLAETGLPAEDLTLEMTESVLIDNADETLRTLTALRGLGVRLAIDDFGTGYSSLSYLHRFPVDSLKIDRSFVQRLSHGGDAAALISTILRLAQSMRLETVAEGIEHAEQMLVLRRQGCTTGQGYHFSPAVHAAAIGDLLADQDLASPSEAPTAAPASVPAPLPSQRIGRKGLRARAAATTSGSRAVASGAQAAAPATRPVL
jgi:diguanylate cyclase (GGDEF)-like protein/PAS domain S-box-containing protein